MNLYELTGAYLQLQNLMEDPDIDSDLIDVRMSEINGDLEDKADNYAKLIRNMESNLNGIAAEMERLKTKKNLLESSVKRLKDNLQASMIATGKIKFQTDLFSFNVQKNGGKAPVVLDVKDTSELPDDLVRITEAPDLDAIRALIEKNGSCKYAHLGEKGQSLRIK